MKNLLKVFFNLFLVQLISNSSLIAECNFGLLIPISGEYASAGQECLAGHELAKERNASKNLPIKFIVEDSKAQGKEGVSLFKKLVEVDRVQAVQLVRAPVGLAINPISKQMQIPILGAVAIPAFIQQNPYAYQFWPSTDDESSLLAQIMIQDGIKNIYSLTREDDWLLSFEQGLIKKFKELGGSLRETEHVDPEFNDFRSIILKIKQSNADTVFVGLAPNQLAIFIKQFRSAGMQQKIYTTFMIRYEDVLKGLTKELLDKITYVETGVEKLNFTLQYKKLTNGKEPSAMGYSCYLTSEAIYQACERHQIDNSNFQTIFSEMKDIATWDEVVNFKNQKAKFEVVAREYSKGNIIKLAPAP